MLAAEPGRLSSSDWTTVDSEHLGLFAEATYITDRHTDMTIPNNSPIDPGYLDGFLLLGMIIHFQWNRFPFRDDDTWALNYGLDRVRFPTPVWIDERIRCHIDLVEAGERQPGRILVKTRNTIEV